MKTIPVTWKAPAELLRYIKRLNARTGEGWRMRGPVYRVAESAIGPFSRPGGWDRACLVNEKGETRRMVRVGRWQKS